MDSLKIAALMCSKVCHDLISPVGAFANGVEVLEEDDDPDMRAHAVALLSSSADQATAKLKFARLAYGAAGSMGTEIDLAEAEVAIRELHGKGKVAIHWEAPRENANKDVVKVLVNMAHLAFDSIPRGGDLDVTIRTSDGAGDVSIFARGERPRLKEEVALALDGKIAVDDLDAHSVVPHVCGTLAREFGGGITHALTEEGVRFSFTF